MSNCGNAFSFQLNGESVRVSGVSPNTTLLNWIRAQGHTGTKEGCAEGDCGACTLVVVDSTPGGKKSFRTINSCIALLPTIAGKDVWTVEGIAKQGKHRVQSAMQCQYGSQCGFCTPGFVASLFEGYYRDDIVTADDLNDQLAGNLCRCTGYRPIRDAARSAWGAKESDAFEDRLTLPDAEVTANYTAGDERFYQPESLAELWKFQEKYPDATLIAGGTEVGVAVAKTFKRYPVFIGLQRVQELMVLEADDNAVLLGGGVPLTDLMPVVRERLPALYEMCRWFASRPIRNRATLGGNLATASPIGDTAPVLISLGASGLLASPAGNREVFLKDFFIGYRKTVLLPGEFITAIKIPALKNSQRSGAYKVSKRREMDISILSAGCVLDCDEAGVIREACLAFGGVAATPALATRAMEFLKGKTLTAEVIDEAAKLVEDEFSPITDGRGSAEYRKKAAAGLWRKFAAGEPSSIAAKHPTDESAHVDALLHESGARHVDGSARYVDDDAERAGALTVWPLVSPHAHARILRRDASRALAVPGVVTVLMAEDVPGLNDTGPAKHDEILLAHEVVEYIGHIVAVVVGESPEACRAGAALIEVDYEPLESVVSVQHAIQKELFHTDFNRIARGEPDAALDTAALRFEGEFEFGGQNHFYLECQAAWAEITEDDMLMVHSSTQHPSEIQTIVAQFLNWDRNRVIAHSPRMGGGFGGKETQGNGPAALAALAAVKTQRPCRVRFNRDQDMMITGQRHPFYCRFEVGADDKGRLLAVKVDLFSNGGWSLDLSMPICDRALFHLDNAYYIRNVHFRGRVCKTHLASNTAFRGFGGPQGMLIIEEIIDRVARRLGIAPALVRERNLYHSSGETNTTHYGQEIGDNRIPTMWHQLQEQAGLTKRQKEIAAFNAASPNRKRGIAQTPVKFGISFTHTPYNQAGALVLVYTDGSVQVNHGGTEMGQGLYTKMLGVAARELGLPPSAIRVTQTRTDKVPNTSATAASSGSDLNGGAVRSACEQIRERLLPVAAQLLTTRGLEVDQSRIVFADGKVFDSALPDEVLTFREVVTEAHTLRTQLAAFGFYRTPDIHYDREAGRGRPFFYFACGSAISEVEVDLLTGQSRVLRVDILHDVGESLNAGIDRGQIEGGFIQGMGWLTSEEVVWDDKGHMLSHCASTYEIPTIGDVPAEFHVRFLENAAQPGVIHGSKAVGEPPLMLAISVREAIRDALAAAGVEGEIGLASPATCESVFRALNRMEPSRDSGQRLRV